MSYKDDGMFSSPNHDYSHDFAEIADLNEEKSIKMSPVEKQRRKTKKKDMDLPAMNIRRVKSNSFCLTNMTKKTAGESRSLTGAIVMLLKEKNNLTLNQIVEHIKPTFNILERSRKNSVINDVHKSVQGCLYASKNKTFKKNKKNNQWSLLEDESASNYFGRLDKKLKKNCSNLNIKKRDHQEYHDIIENLKSCLGYFSKKAKVFTIIKKNPFKMIKRNKKIKKLDNVSMEEQMLSNIVNFGNSANKGERLIGILQCFYYFYPILKDFSKSNNAKMGGLLSKLEKTIERLDNVNKKS